MMILITNWNYEDSNEPKNVNVNISDYDKANKTLTLPLF